MQTETRQCRYSVMTYPPHDRYVGRSLQVYGEYSDLEVDFLRLLLRPGDLALDVGANLGAITIGMAERVGPTGLVHAFEPQRPIYEILAANATRFPNIIPHCAAVGAAPAQSMCRRVTTRGSATSAGSRSAASRATKSR